MKAPVSDIRPDRLHSDKEIKEVVQIRKLFKNKSAKLINKEYQTEKEHFINHYDNLFNNGASELPGILELYSVLSKRKKERPSAGKGFLFNLEPEDAKKYYKEILKYFMVKNYDALPNNKIVKIAIDSYLELMTFSKVDKSYVEKTKSNLYEKYKFR
jgi:hypothetical protein